MGADWLLAWRYIRFYRLRTAILVAALAVTACLPLGSRWAAQRFERSARQRALATPLIIGVKGSRFGLAMHALYFRGESPPTLKQAEVQRIEQTGLAQVIPLHVRFRTRDVPIVGTTAAYFRFRDLGLARGQPLRRLGDCVVGAAAARRLGIEPGDRLLSEPEGLFDLSGPAPLNMRVTGILAPTGTADDDVVLCDLRTAWIIEGIGHGHQLASGDPGADHLHEAGRGILEQYQEVTDENFKSFHFHGRRGDYPLTALIALPDSERSETLLLGKYLGPDEAHQILRPIEVVEELMQLIGRVQQLFDLGLALLACATALLLLLVMSLSIRLRQREMRTLFLLGCSRGTIARLIATELAIVLTISLLVALAMAQVGTWLTESLWLRFL